MISDPCVLPGSLTTSNQKNVCFKCGVERTVSGGVDLGPMKFVCGPCWRTRAARKQGALAGLTTPRRANG